MLDQLCVHKRTYIKSSVELCGSRILLCRTMYWVIQSDCGWVWQLCARIYVATVLHVDLTILKIARL
jgi:hypothetical protein